MEKAVNSLPAGLEGLIALVKTLRSDDGCPWDREQTPEQIKTYLLEEAYELLDALESGNHEDICTELGDLLFHIVFLAGIFEEAGDFNMSDVLQKITEKMIRRHPHVFGQAQVSSPEEVRDRWHETKMAEAKDKERAPSSFLDSVPQKLPALMRAYRISERAAKLGFHRTDVDSVLMQLDKELAELKAVVKSANSEKSAEKLGDLLFTMVNLARFVRVHPEAALARTISKFVGNVQKLMQAPQARGTDEDPAVIGLLQCFERRDLNALLAILFDETIDYKVRIRAAELTGELGLVKSIELLRNYNFKDQRVDNAVHNAIKRAHEINRSRECPYCAEIIEAEATVCSECGRELRNQMGATSGN